MNEFESWWNDAVGERLERLVGPNEAIRLQVAAEHADWVEALRGAPARWTAEHAERVAAQIAEQGRRDDAFLEQAPPEVHDPPNN